MNLDQIRARLAGLNSKSNKKRDLWKPKDKHVIRCLPYPHGDGDPFTELGFHYNIGDARSILCPKHTNGDDCVICDYSDQLRSWNNEDGSKKPDDVREADYKIWKDISCKPRWYIPMVERGKEAEGPRFYAFSKTIYESMLKMCLDEEMNEDVDSDGGTLVLTDVKSAYDITVDFYKPNNEDGKGNTKNWAVTEIKEKKRPSKLSVDADEAKSLVAKVSNIMDIYPQVSSAEVEKLFNKFLGSTQEELKGDEDDGKEYKANSAEAPVTGGQSIDEAFDELTSD